MSLVLELSIQAPGSASSSGRALPSSLRSTIENRLRSFGFPHTKEYIERQAEWVATVPLQTSTFNPVVIRTAVENIVRGMQNQIRGTARVYDDEENELIYDTAIVSSGMRWRTHPRRAKPIDEPKRPFPETPGAGPR